MIDVGARVPPLVQVDDLVVQFRGSRRQPLAPRPIVHAVDGVSFEVGRGGAFGIVGESGSGKSTTALALMQLVAASAGSISIGGELVSTLRGRALRQARRRFQMVFQDPFSSLDPRRRAGQLIREPLDLLSVGEPSWRARRVEELIEAVGLSADAAAMFPHQFSGGQRQRLAIARALASGPELLVCDEPVSALDVAIQAQILNLLARLRRDLALTLVFISHDLGVVQHLCDEVAVMYLGRIVERAPTPELFAAARHPYTWSLMAAAAGEGPEGAKLRRRYLVPGEPPSPMAPPPGCHFSARCPHVLDRCRTVAPLLHNTRRNHLVACHRAEELETPLLFSH